LAWTNFAQADSAPAVTLTMGLLANWLQTWMACVWPPCRGWSSDARTSNSHQRSNSTNAKTKLQKLKRLSTTYEGPYITLVNFLQECRERGCKALTAEQHEKLLAAVESLSKQGSQDVSIHHDFFKGENETNSKQALLSWGVKCDKDKDKDNNSKEEKPRKPTFEYLSESSRGVALRDTTGRSVSEMNADFAALLSGMSFNNLWVGNIPASIEVLMHGFTSLDQILSRYSIKPSKLSKWIAAVAEQYNEVPFHNWGHAVGVFQFLYVALTTGGAERFFNFMDILTLLVAAVGHDVGHFGVNNIFLIKTSHTLSITYNDVSPLENMHASTCFQTLSQDGLDFLSSADKHTRTLLREKVIQAILSTDMAHHFEHVDRFSARVADSNPWETETKHCRERQQASKSDRRMLLQSFVQMADLGHNCRPWDVHKHMIVALEEEFFRQGDQERELNMLPIMPMMDRQAGSAASAQGFFLGKMVKPLLLPFTKFVQPQLGEDLVKSIDENIQTWADLLAKHGEKMTAAQLVPKDEAEHESPASPKTPASPVLARLGSVPTVFPAALDKRGSAHAATL